MKKITILIVMCLIFGLTGLFGELDAADAAVYYVDCNHPSASDSNIGTINQPFLTIQRAADVVVPGDKVYVRGGIYYPLLDRADSCVLDIRANGTAANPITFIPYQNETVTLSDSSVHSTASRSRLVLIQGDYIIFDGFRVNHFKGRGIEVINGDNFVIQNIEIFDGYSPADYYVGWGIFIRRANTGLIRNNRIYHNQAGIIVAGPGLDYIEGKVTDVVVEHNYVYDNHARQVANDGDSDGIQIGSGSRGVVVRNNVVQNNGDDGIDIFMCYDTKIIGNVCYNHTQWGNGNGFKSNTGGGGNHIFIRNISFGNKASGFNIETDTDSRASTFTGKNYGDIFYHNIAFNNQLKGLITGSTTERVETDYIVKNNIIFNNHLNPSENIEYRHVQAASSVGGAVSDYNIWGDLGLNMPPYLEGSQSDLNAVDPNVIKFADFNNITVVTDLNSPDFGRVIGLELAQNSPAIDRGTFALFSTAAGTNSVISVDGDPTKYFLIGDTIQIENAGRATIVDMDAVAQTITVDSVLTFAAGAGVHWPWDGTAPDRGAIERSTTGHLWSFNQADYGGYPYYYPVYGTAMVNGTHLAVGDYIGAFDKDGNCYGISQYQYDSATSTYYFMLSIYSESQQDGLKGFLEGDRIFFRFYRAGTGDEILNVISSPVTLHYYPDVRSGDIPPQQINLVSADVQTIDLKKGWNAISFNVTPETATITEAFAAIIGNLEYVSNHMQWWDNGIGGSLQKVNAGESYYIKVSADCSLPIIGLKMPLPHTFFLKRGWNSMSYLYDTPNFAIGRTKSGYTGVFKDIIQYISWIKGANGRWCTPDIGDLTLADGGGIFIKLLSDTNLTIVPHIP